MDDSEDKIIYNKPPKNVFWPILTVFLAILTVGVGISSFFIGKGIGYDAGRINAKDEYYYARYDEGYGKGKTEYESKLRACEWNLDAYKK